jgi:hypothetical protein
LTVALHDLPGVWRRSLLVRPDGSSDTTTTVLWVQGPALYADLRLPHPDRPATDSGHAPVEGFAGELVLTDGVFEWCRRIDLSPPGPYADRGRLAFTGDVLVEDGVEVCYAEHWHREPDSIGPSGAKLLIRPGTEALLVRAGSYIAYATSGPTSGPEISIGRLDGDDWVVAWSSRPELVGERRPLDAGGWRVSYSEGEGL